MPGNVDLKTAVAAAGMAVAAAAGGEVLTLLPPARVPHDDVRVVARIPRDPRHASKIDYGALEV